MGDYKLYTPFLAASLPLVQDLQEAEFDVQVLAAVATTGQTLWQFNLQSECAT